MQVPALNASNADEVFCFKRYKMAWTWCAAAGTIIGINLNNAGFAEHKARGVERHWFAEEVRVFAAVGVGCTCGGASFIVDVSRTVNLPPIISLLC